MHHSRARTPQKQTATQTRREELESARAVLARALEKTTRRRHRRLFEALVATADYRLGALKSGGDDSGQ